MKTILALVAFCVVQSLEGTREDNFRSSYFNLLPEHRLAGQLITTTTANSELSCAHKCLAHNGCKSCNFRQSGEKHENCELNSRGLVSQPGNPTLVHDEEFIVISLENQEPPPYKTVSSAPGTSNAVFELFQTFPTQKGAATIAFLVDGHLFLAFANRVARSRGLSKTKMPIYQLQQQNFTLNQTLFTLGVFGVEHFSIYGEHFLAVANGFGTSNGGDKIFEVDSVVYRWEAGRFKTFQRIPTNNAFQLHYFAINERKFLLVVNRLSELISIYEWKNGYFSAKIQDISLKRLYRCNTFAIRNITYIACGKSSGDKGTATAVLKWSGSQFESFQNLPSTSVRGPPYSFQANGTVYLAIANFKGGASPSVDTDSYVYRWDRGKFVHHQSIPTRGAMAWDSFATANGEVFLVVANRLGGGSAKQNVRSAVYKMVYNKFNLYQQLPPPGAQDVCAFTYNGEQYLAVVYFSKGVDSAVYIWK